METLFNKHRIYLGFIEYFIFSALTAIILVTIQKSGIDTGKYGLIWVFVFGYWFILPLFFKGRTIFMLVLRLELRKNGELISQDDFIKRTIFKIPYLAFGGAFVMLIAGKGIPFYDKSLEIELVQNNTY